MGLVVRKSSLEVVRPAEPVMAAGDINLLPYEKNFMCVPATVFLAFDRPIHAPAETVKSSLSKALVHYLAISGRLAVGPGQDELRITRTGEGVSFVAATTSWALKDLKSLDQSVPELAMYYPAEFCGLSDPLLMMQVTEFSCGGFVIGVTWNHVIADAAGMGQFLQAIGELARGLSSPSVVPVRCDDLFTGVTAPADGFVELMQSLQPVDLAILDIAVTTRTINSIKEDYRVHSNGGTPCTTFEAVTALLWQCRTRAIASNPEDPVALYFSVNARKYVGASDGYYGNCVTGRLVVATWDAVANGHLMEVVEMIQRAKSQIAEQFKMGPVEQVGGLLRYNIFLVTSWGNLGLEEVDFGGGTPARVTSHIQQRVRVPTCVACKGIDGSYVLSACVMKEHADSFLGQLSSSTSNL